MICKCEDWQPNVDIINGYISFGTIHYGFNPKGYDGKPFKYCPWCGKQLEEKNDDKRT